MVVQRHPCALLYEEEHESVVVAALNGDAVQLLLEVEGVVGAFYTQGLEPDVVHLFDEPLAAWVSPGVVEEGDGVTCVLGAQTHILDG